MNEQQWLAGAQQAAPVKNKRNPLFFVLAVLSAIPTAFFLLAVIIGEGHSTLTGISFLWCFMWTWVWWKMSDRYR